MATYLALGDVHPDQDPTRLITDGAKATLALCSSRTDFLMQELATCKLQDIGQCDVLVVDCANDQVPSRNAIGIKVRERLALVFPHDRGILPQVRALREDFPPVPHLNHVPHGEPSSLCLYFEPWTVVQRTWTPQKHLHRVLWWLAETAKGSLHRRDQEVERIYFDSPWHVILPPDLDDKFSGADSLLTLVCAERDDVRRTLRAVSRSAADVAQKGFGGFVPLLLDPKPVVQGRIEKFAERLGALDDQLVARGSALLDPLRGAIQRQAGQRGIPHASGQACLLILQVPIRRTAESDPELRDVFGFIVLEDLATLGSATGALLDVNGRYCPAALLGSAPPELATRWRDIPIVPVAVKSALTRNFARRASGIGEVGAAERRVLAGLGALGGALADIWSREAWGEWTFVDSDYVQPHNLVRHVAKDSQIGAYKVDAVKGIVDANYYPGYRASRAIRGSALRRDLPALDEAMKDAALIVDVTTALDVPRDLSQRDDISRAASLFLTPSGSASVLLLEDAKRELRLDALEPQYYRAILNNEWGSGHLAGHQAHLWVGAGCRDSSVIMSPEMVGLHAAILARQLRLLSGQPGSQIRIWTTDDKSGAVEAVEVAAHPARVAVSQGWSVVSDDGIESKLNKLRHEHLPNETGGVILGYVDHVLKRIFVVDVLPAPPDSEGSPSGFSRGVEGLSQQIEDVKRRTANIVGYVGEWHSHPPAHSPRPSRADGILMEHLATVLAQDGEPALMMIVGSGNGLSYTVRLVE